MKYIILMSICIVILFSLIFFLYVDDLKDNIKFLNGEIKQYNNEAEEQENLIMNLRIMMKDMNYKMNTMQKDIWNLRDRKIINMNPTLKQVKEFMINDYTDEIEWSEEYDCTEISNIWISNALNKNEGFFSCTTELEFKQNEGHIIVSINTSDQGIIYIEPQKDKIIYNLEVGNNYCNKVNWKCEYIINKITNCFEFK